MGIESSLAPPTHLQSSPLPHTHTHNKSEQLLRNNNNTRTHKQCTCCRTTTGTSFPNTHTHIHTITGQISTPQNLNIYILESNQITLSSFCFLPESTPSSIPPESPPESPPLLPPLRESTPPRDSSPGPPLLSHVVRPLCYNTKHHRRVCWCLQSRFQQHRTLVL